MTLKIQIKLQHLLYLLKISNLLININFKKSKYNTQNFIFHWTAGPYIK